MNPGGRPKAIQGASARLAREIQARAGEDGSKLLDVLWSMLFGKANEQIKAHTTADMRLRAEIVGMLLDRGFGKPVQQIDLDVSDGAGDLAELVRDLSPSRLADLDALLADDEGAGGAPGVQ